jgi:hypothetical protein
MGLRGGCARASAANPLLKWRRRRRLLQPRNNDAVTAAALARSQERHADGARALRGAVVFAGCEKARAGPVAASAAWGYTIVAAAVAARRTTPPAAAMVDMTAPLSAAAE